MKRYDDKSVWVGLLLMMALTTMGCASNGTSGYSHVEYGYGYYGGYGASYYERDVIVTRPPGQSSSPPQASQLPARSLPRAAPRGR